MARWLFKSEPESFGYSDLVRVRREGWDGVRSFQARNFMRAMKLDDLALFYHSSTSPPGVVGVMRVCKEAYPDPTQFDPKSDYYDAKSPKAAPRWDRVEVEFVEKLTGIVTLEQLKADPKLSEMLVIRRGQRLSVQPVDKADFAHVLKLGSAKTKLTAKA